MTTFAKLLAKLSPLEGGYGLVFRTADGEIGPGYHVVELRHSLSVGIDCGGNIEAWPETRLQLLDGQGGQHMTVGKFRTIVEKSLTALPSLADGPLLVEFGHDNSELKLMSLGKPEVREHQVHIPLGQAQAVCKPLQKAMSADEPMDEGRSSQTHRTVPQVEASACCT